MSRPEGFSDNDFLAMVDRARDKFQGGFCVQPDEPFMSWVEVMIGAGYVYFKEDPEPIGAWPGVRVLRLTTKGLAFLDWTKCPIEPVSSPSLPLRSAERVA
jgi:hypothetical protein